MALVITGNPGVGKHTIATHLAQSLDLEILDLNQLAIHSGVATRSADTLDVDTVQLEKIVRRHTRKNSLLVGHLAPYVVDGKQVSKALVLRRDPYKLGLVYEQRAYLAAKRIENQASEILGIIAHDTIVRFGEDKTFQIDTTHRTILDTVSVSLDIIHDKKASDYVDWLSLVESKGDMARFFPTK